MKLIKERIKETSNIPQSCRTEYPPVPKSVKIEVTSRCDLKCFFCSVTNKKRKKGDIKKGLMMKILEDLSKNGVEEVGLFWLGEPLLVKELPEYVRYAKKVGIKYVFITTNGRLATEERILPLLESGIDSIKFSINAWNRDQYLKVCKVDAFDQVIANVKNTCNLRKDKEKTKIYVSSVYDPNEKETYNHVRELVGPYVDQHYSLRIYGKFNYKEFTNDYKQEVAPRTLETILPCWPLFTLPHINYEGNLSACYCDHDSKFFMANLKDMPFKEAWYAPKLVELRKKHLSKNVKGTVCENCIAYGS